MKYIYTAVFWFGSCWLLLGFKRGLERYDYYYNKGEIKMYKTVDKGRSGIIGVLIYVNPMFLLPLIIKEYYKLKVNFKNLTYEKESLYYNDYFIM